MRIWQILLAVVMISCQQSKVEKRQSETVEPTPLDPSDQAATPADPSTPTETETTPVLAEKTLLSSEEIKLATDEHNRLRKAVGVDDLTWNDDLAKFAQTWANELATNRNCELAHRPDTGAWARTYGENIYPTFKEELIESAMEAWEKQKDDYKEGDVIVKDAGEKVIGNYTQVVWSSSKRFGCGKVQCTDRLFILVCNYDPPGNIIDETPY